MTSASRLINSDDFEGGPLKARTNPQSSPKDATGQEYGMEWLNTVASVFLIGLTKRSPVRIAS